MADENNNNGGDNGSQDQSQNQNQNQNSSTENNNNNNATSSSDTEQNKPADTPAPAPEKVEEKKEDAPADKPAEDNSSTSTSTANNEPAKSEVSASENQPSADVITLKIEGMVKGEHSFPKGTKLKDAISQFTSEPGTMQFREGNKAFGLDRVLNTNTTLTSTAKAANS